MKCLFIGLVVLTFASATTATASTIWTDWTNAVPGEPGSASGTLNGITVCYSGQVLSSSVIDGTSTRWAPDSSFVGGTITTSPDIAGDIITTAGSTSQNSITFSSPVTNPVFAIWSLGSRITATTASFTFNETPTFQVGGGNAGFGGSSISVVGNTVSGREGNGAVEFIGTFNSISWDNTPEHYFGFTVGTNVPEPSTIALLLCGGLFSIIWLKRRR